MVAARWIRFLGLAGALLALPACTVIAQDNSQSTRWKDFGFLLGTWEGMGSGAPGQGAGGFTFATELQGTILVRRSRADYPATKDKAAYSHEDLTIVTRETAGDMKAVYFDNEGHIIHYLVQARGDSVIFLSDTSSATPRYRLTYLRTAPETLKITFDIAPPGKSDAFTRYIEANASRKKTSK